METRQKAYEDEKDQPPKETLEKSRDGARGVDEGSAGIEDNRPVEAAGPRQRKERRRQQKERRRQKKERLYGNSYRWAAPPPHPKLAPPPHPKPAPPPPPPPHPKPAPPPPPKPAPPPPPELSEPAAAVPPLPSLGPRYQQVDQQPAAQRQQSPQTIVDVPDQQRERTEEMRRQREEEMKSAFKFSYFSTAMAGAGLITIFSGFLGNQTGQGHTVHLKVCTFFMLVAFVSGASMVLLALRLSSDIIIEIFRSLQYTTLGFLILAVFDVSILFFKKFAILAFVPTLFVVMIAIIMTFRHNGFRWSQHQGDSGRPSNCISDAV